MKNLEYWKRFFKSGKIDDYLNYIACAREEYDGDPQAVVSKEEGGINAGVDYSEGNSTISHAGW
ncbi:MAG TPA: hypothetical protein GXZ28_03585 [Clostridiales bacterium]|jgi:hypothetical protein|nr:hypothetical protein [Clostridiales bacterium]